MTNRSLLIVDDESHVIEGIKRQLRSCKYTIYSANSGEAGFKILKKHDIGAVLSDRMMPNMDGVQFLERVQKEKPNVIRMLLTGHGTLQSAVSAVNRSHVFAYLSKPCAAEELKETLSKAFEHYNLVMENKRLQRLAKVQNKKLKFINKNLDDLVNQRTMQLQEAVREGIVMLALAAEAKDDDTGEHVYRIRKTTQKICIGLGMYAEQAQEVGFFSMMHDVGKIHVPDRILKKPGSLTPEEWAIMKTHTTAGEKIMGNKPFYNVAREIARSHHERWDGNGYPDKLKGEEIPLPARIVIVTDIFDALTHERPYKPAWPVDEALTEMKSLSGKTFDPEILDVFLHTLSNSLKDFV